MKEPQRWIDTLLHMHQRMNSNSTLLHRTPIFADIRVLSYPLLLVGLYCYGRHKNTKTHKTIALYLFTTTIAVFIINYAIKAFIRKERPYLTLWLTTPKEELLLNKIPSDTFPSDHAAVSAAIATWLLMRGIRNKKKAYVYLSIPFRGFSISMGISRIMIGIHRPTDIMMGRAIGIGMAVALNEQKILQKRYNYTISIEEKITKYVFRKKTEN